MKPILTPRELAQAIGVSESSVKRWVDDGSIGATRTAGGHRRIPIGEAVRFIRDSRSVLLRPDLLGLSDVASVAASFPGEGESADALYEQLRSGASEEAKGLVLTLYLNGLSIAEIVDGPLRESMTRLGELWQHAPEGIFVEHRGSEIAHQALSRLRTLLPQEPSRPVAVGGAAPGDPYQLPTLCAAIVLDAAGFTAVNLGPDLPMASLELAIENLGASLAWISSSASTLAPETGDDIARLAERLAAKRVPLVVGGRSAVRLGLRSAGNLRVGRSMAELEAVAQGMRFSGNAALRPN